MANNQNQEEATRINRIPLRIEGGNVTEIGPWAQRQGAMGGPDDRPLGNLVKVHDKSSKSGIRQVYKFTKPSGDDRFFVASGTFKNKKDKDRLMRSLQERVALYATGDEEYRSVMGQIDSRTGAGEASGEVKIQEAQGVMNPSGEEAGEWGLDEYEASQVNRALMDVGKPLTSAGTQRWANLKTTYERRPQYVTKGEDPKTMYTRTLGAHGQKQDPQSYFYSNEFMDAYPVPSYKEPRKSMKDVVKGIGSGIKRGVIGEEVKDVYGQPQHSMSLLNVLKNFGDAFTMFNDINLPGERTEGGFDWGDEDMVAAARQRQSLFDEYQGEVSRAEQYPSVLFPKGRAGGRQGSAIAQKMLEEYARTLRRGQGSARGQIAPAEIYTRTIR